MKDWLAADIARDAARMPRAGEGLRIPDRENVKAWFSRVCFAANARGIRSAAGTPSRNEVAMLFKMGSAILGPRAATEIIDEHIPESHA